MELKVRAAMRDAIFAVTTQNKSERGDTNMMNFIYTIAFLAGLTQDIYLV